MRPFLLRQSSSAPPPPASFLARLLARSFAHDCGSIGCSCGFGDCVGGWVDGRLSVASIPGVCFARMCACRLSTREYACGCAHRARDNDGQVQHNHALQWALGLPHASRAEGLRERTRRAFSRIMPPWRSFRRMYVYTPTPTPTRIRVEPMTGFIHDDPSASMALEWGQGGTPHLYK